MNTEIEKLNAEIVELCNHIPDAKDVIQNVNKINEEKTQELLKLYLLEFRKQLTNNKFPIQIHTIQNESSSGFNAYRRFCNIITAKGYDIHRESNIAKITIQEMFEKPKEKPDWTKKTIQGMNLKP